MATSSTEPEQKNNRSTDELDSVDFAAITEHGRQVGVQGI